MPNNNPPQINTGIKLQKSNPELAHNRLFDGNLEYLTALKGINKELSAFALKHYNATYRVGKAPIVGEGDMNYDASNLSLKALHDDKEHPGNYLIGVSKEG